MERFFVPYEATATLEARAVAVLAPHADDEVFGCGGTLAGLAARGVPVWVAVVSGSGRDGAETGPQAVVPAERRRAESAAAAALLGYPVPEFWGLPDGDLNAVADLADRVFRWLEGTGADLLLAPSCWEMHRDHRAVAEAALAAAARSGKVRLAFYEVGIPLPSVNRLMDITPQRDLKRRAMACFASQLALQRYDEQIGGLNAYRTYTLPPPVRAVEALLLLAPEAVRDGALLRQAEAASLTLREAAAEVGRHQQALSAQEARHQAATDALNAQLATLDAERVRQVAALEAELDRHLQALAAMTADRDDQLQALAAMTADRDRQVRELTAMTADRNHVLDHLHALQRSTSWRVTAPLRWMGHLLRGRFREAARRVVPGRVRHALRVRWSRLRVWMSLLTCSPANGPALDFLVAQRCRETAGPLGSDPLSATALPPGVAAPRVDVCAVTHNSRRWIDAFAQSLLALDYPRDRLCVWLVDNASTDDTVVQLETAGAALLAAGIQVEILRRPNRGFGAGNNAAIRAGNAPFCLVTNVDLTFEPASLTRVVATALSERGEVAAWELRQKPYEHPKFYDPVTGYTNWNSHACVLLLRSAVEAVGGYDDTIFMYGEDVDLSYRLRRQGYLLRYCPAAAVTHLPYDEPRLVKPLQYNGSTFASLYLRLKYGTWSDVASLPVLALNLLTQPEAYPGSRRAVWRSLARVARHAPRALLSRCPSTAHFPFRVWEFELAREGAFYPVAETAEADHEAPAPLVSIITRTYRGRSLYLRQALLSVAHQTWGAVEHIVVEDGGSTQQDVVAQVGAVTGRPARFIGLPRMGRSAAGNAGLAAATGRWCLFLDDDDLLFADHVAVLAQALEAHPGAAAAYAPAWEVLTDTADLAAGRYVEKSHSVPLPLQEPFDRQVLRHHNLMAIQSVLFERRLFLERGGFEEDMEALEDWVLWLRYSLGETFVRVPRVTSLYRTPARTADYRKRLEVLDAAYRQALARVPA